MSEAQVRTETFTLLAICEWFNVRNCRSETRSADRQSPVMAVVFWAPLGRIFHTVPFGLREIVALGLVASLVLWVEELRKLVARRRGRRGESTRPSDAWRTPQRVAASGVKGASHDRATGARQAAPPAVAVCAARGGEPGTGDATPRTRRRRGCSFPGRPIENLPRRSTAASARATGGGFSCDQRDLQGAFPRS